MFGKGDIDMDYFNKKQQLIKIEIVRSLGKKLTPHNNNSNDITNDGKFKTMVAEEAQVLFDWIWQDSPW